MKKLLPIITLIIVLVFSCLSLTACNASLEKSEFDLPVGSYPSSYSDTISDDEHVIINNALQETATEEQKKAAVMVLYNVANNSRINTPISLMIQKTDMIPAVKLGYVAMRGFTLKNGDDWFYQFAAQGVSDDETAAILFNAFGSQQLQLAYKKDGKFYYSKEMSDKPQCDCTSTTFPYATFNVVKELTEYENEEDFKAARYYLKSQLEINNMDLCTEIIADGSTITFDESKKIYTVKFAVDCENSDSELLEKWYACANKDMQDSGNKIIQYNKWEATMEVWANGYIKSFVSEEDREAGSGGSGAFAKLAGGQTTNAFEYLYDENEILTLLSKDERFGDMASTYSLNEFMDGYIAIANNQQPAGMSQLVKIIIIVVVVLVVVIIGIIILVEVLVKKGKLPKLANRRAKRKEKRLAKKNKK